MKRLPISIAAGSLCALVAAANLGRWYCGDCTFEPSGTARGVRVIPDVIAFIRANNLAIMDSIAPEGRVVARWVPNDLITVCDGKLCVPNTYHASGAWFPLGPTYQDPRRDYKNPEGAPQPRSNLFRTSPTTWDVIEWAEPAYAFAPGGQLSGSSGWFSGGATWGRVGIGQGYESRTGTVTAGTPVVVGGGHFVTIRIGETSGGTRAPVAEH